MLVAWLRIGHWKEGNCNSVVGLNGNFGWKGSMMGGDLVSIFLHYLLLMIIPLVSGPLFVSIS